tara:strand:+ start:272 stop:874 length:603 start_codon:yes stop_codon:yes gene_type:complete
MVEVECPSCTKSVDLGSDSPGTYECPYCSEDFQYEVDKSTRDTRLIDEIEYGGLKPDYVLQERRYQSSIASKIIPTMVAICFIPLLGIGFILLWFIWSDGTMSNHDYMAVFLKKQNLVLDYYLLNGEIERSDSFELTEQSVITWHSVGSSEYPSSLYVLRDNSTGESMSLPTSIDSNEIREFAEYVDIDYMSRDEWEESN